jgi:hypothetical protein
VCTVLRFVIRSQEELCWAVSQETRTDDVCDDPVTGPSLLKCDVIGIAGCRGHARSVHMQQLESR